MKKISRHGKDIYFDRIIAFGCSYTSGMELVDHKYYPGNLGAVIVDDIKRNNAGNKYTTGQTAFYSTFSDVQFRQIENHQKTVSWVATLAHKFGVPCINNGRIGSSMQEIVYDIELNISKGNIRDTDLVIVGCTSMDRWMYFKNGIHSQ